MATQEASYLVLKSFDKFTPTNPPTHLTAADLSGCDIPWLVKIGAIKATGLRADNPSPEEYRAEVERLQDAYDTASAEVERLTAEIADLKTANEGLKGELQEARSRPSGLQSADDDATDSPKPPPIVTGDDASNPIAPLPQPIAPAPPRIAPTAPGGNRLASMRPPTPKRASGQPTPLPQMAPLTPAPPLPPGIPPAPGIVTERPE